MFSALRKEKPLRRQAIALYDAAMTASRAPLYYRDLAVPDTMDGRFDLLMVHVFLIMHRLLDEPSRTEALSQALFDICFADIDQALRESGIGDMGISKHMKKMMLAFNGRMHAYEEALKSHEPDVLEETLIRNLYGTCDPVPVEAASRMAGFIRDNVAAFKAQGLDDIMAGRVKFLEMK